MPRVNTMLNRLKALFPIEHTHFSGRSMFTQNAGVQCTPLPSTDTHTHTGSLVRKLLMTHHLLNTCFVEVFRHLPAENPGHVSLERQF